MLGAYVSQRLGRAHVNFPTQSSGIWIGQIVDIYLLHCLECQRIFSKSYTGIGRGSKPTALKQDDGKDRHDCQYGRVMRAVLSSGPVFPLF